MWRKKEAEVPGVEEEYCALGLVLLFQSPPLREEEQTAGNRALGGIPAPAALIPGSTHMHRGWEGWKWLILPQRARRSVEGRRMRRGNEWH